METMIAEVAIELRSQLAEGPWWDERRERLLWVDIPAGRIHAHAPAAGATDTAVVGEPVGFVIGREDSWYMAGTAAGLVALDAQLRPAGVVVAPPDLDGKRRINDGTCDAAGRILFGTVDPSGGRPGTLWSYCADGRLIALVEGVAMSNGLAFSPDERTLYYVDSPTRRIDAFDYDVASGSVSGRRAIWHLHDVDGLPDGLSVDVEGCLWVAIWGAGEVRRLTPGGAHVATIQVPASATSSCAFGGQARDRLYITTAHADRETLAGAVFAVDTDTRGCIVRPAGSGVAYAAKRDIDSILLDERSRRG